MTEKLPNIEKVNTLALQGAHVAVQEFYEFVERIPNDEINQLSAQECIVLLYNVCSIFAFIILLRLNEKNDITKEQACANVDELSRSIREMLVSNWGKIEQARKDKGTTAPSANE